MAQRGDENGDSGLSYLEILGYDGSLSHYAEENRGAQVNIAHATLDALKKLEDANIKNSDIGKMYTMIVFSLPESCSISAKNYIMSENKTRRAKFQEYTRVLLSYTFYSLDLHSVNVDDITGNADRFIGDEEDYPKDSIEKSIIQLIKAYGISDDTYDIIGRAVTKGARDYSNFRSNQNAAIRFKRLKEYTYINNALKSCIPEDPEQMKQFRDAAYEREFTGLAGRLHKLMEKKRRKQ
ncbi:MAG: hypothetical protein NT001_07210 [Candidatus Woesearchaeota archaeon]|nr:hypothetical protein [Candidatus Woesearchaeota archaeon]